MKIDRCGGSKLNVVYRYMDQEKVVDELNKKMEKIDERIKEDSKELVKIEGN